MKFWKENHSLMWKHQYETVCITPWGKNALRIRATKFPNFTSQDWALEEPVPDTSADVSIELNCGENTQNPDASIINASITNGRLCIKVDAAGIMTFYRDGQRILKEYHRDYDQPSCRQSRCLRIRGRAYKAIIGGDYEMKLRFESTDGEKIYGMGQYQQSYLDLKGCTLELAQRNSQTSIPFAVSSLGYGFLWNHPGVGNVVFGRNYTEWEAKAAKQLDYWITVDDNPAKILQNYTEVTGRTPMIDKALLGLWQCKLRYRTQEEVLRVARKYKELGIALDVIVIDFFHWTRQGDWKFDAEYWPDPKAMCDELHAMGTKVVVSVWPTVDKKSENFAELFDRGLLIQTEHGSNQTYEFQGDCLTIDVTNPEAQEYLWEKCKKNYYDYGIDMFWLDNAEPDYSVYDFDNYRYYAGSALEVSNVYPKLYVKTFYEQTKALSLVRCGWAGSQKYASLLWSGDIPSTFESLRDQMIAGLHMGLAGIPWWTTDIGGFMTDDAADPDFRELLLRWFEFAVFTPILRMHGDRGPHDIPPLSEKEWGGGCLFTGYPNELWSYGDEAFDIMKRQLDLRLSLKPYIEKLMQEASETGAPLLRTMFFEFPDDARCWELDDQYMFGNQYLVAPILQFGQREREVYLPAGTWKQLADNQLYEGGQTVLSPAPLAQIPVFERQH